jgi:hypothetical protein
MNIERPRTTPQTIYLLYAWAGALAGLALILWLPSALQSTFISISQHIECASVAIAFCLFAVLHKRIWPSKVKGSLCILLGFISTTLTVSLVS